MLTNQLHAAERDLHPPVAPCEAPDGIQFVYADDRGRPHAIALKDAAAVDFGRVRAFRKPPAYRGSATSDNHSLGLPWDADQPGRTKQRPKPRSGII